MIINKCVVHVLDKESDVPVLNEYDLRINPEVDKFFIKILKKALKSDNLRKARFNKFNDNIVCQCSEQMVMNQDTFLENSKEIAAYLFEVMKINSELESCDLAICTYTVKGETGVAIIKLDYKKLYTHSIEFVDEKFKVNFVPHNMGISESSKLKHCALISGSMGVNDEWHLSLLDEQLSKEDAPSKFVTEFLDAKAIVDDKYKTKVFKNSAETWITNALSEDIKQAEEVRSLLNYTLKEKNEIDLNKFVENSIRNDELKESFKEHMEDKGLDESFNIDKKWVEKKLKKRSIKTDNGFDIKADLVDFEDPMKYSVRQNPDGSVDIVVKNVRFYESN